MRGHAGIACPPQKDVVSRCLNTIYEWLEEKDSKASKLLRSQYSWAFMGGDRTMDRTDVLACIQQDPWNQLQISRIWVLEVSFMDPCPCPHMLELFGGRQSDWYNFMPVVFNVVADQCIYLCVCVGIKNEKHTSFSQDILLPNTLWPTKGGQFEVTSYPYKTITISSLHILEVNVWLEIKLIISDIHISTYLWCFMIHVLLIWYDVDIRMNTLNMIHRTQNSHLS